MSNTNYHHSQDQDHDQTNNTSSDFDRSWSEAFNYALGGGNKNSNRTSTNKKSHSPLEAEQNNTERDIAQDPSTHQKSGSVSQVTPAALPPQNTTHVNKAPTALPPQNTTHVNKAPTALPPQNTTHVNQAPTALPPQNTTHAKLPPRADSSSVVVKQQQTNHTANIPPASIVKNDENREGWCWWAVKGGASLTFWALKGLLSGGWSAFKGFCGILPDILEFGTKALVAVTTLVTASIKMWSFLPAHIQQALVVVASGFYIVPKFIEKVREPVMKLWNKGQKAVLAIGERLGVVAKATGEKIKEAAETTKKKIEEATNGTVNALRGEFKSISLDDAKKLIKAGNNDELAKYLIYENQITMSGGDAPQEKLESAPEEKHNEQETKSEKKEEEPEPTLEKKLEAQEEPKITPEERVRVYRELLEDAITCHNAGAVKLLLKHDNKSVLKQVGGVVSEKICDKIKDSEAKFQGVDIQGDRTLLPQAMVKLFDLKKTLSQYELSRSFVGTTQGVTLDNIGLVEITFKITNERLMQANCLVNKGQNDEFFIQLSCQIATEKTQINNGESAQVNVLDSEEFKQFLTKSITDYHNSLHIIDYLLQKGADPNEMIKVDGLQYNIPLKEAFLKKNSELFVVLLKNQATPSPELIQYAFGYKDPPESDNKPFYELLSTPHCANWMQLWEPWTRADADQPEDNATKEPKKLVSPNTKSQVKELPSEPAKNLLPDEEIYQALVLYQYSKLEGNAKSVNSHRDDSSGGRSLPQPTGANEKQEETKALNSNTDDTLPPTTPRLSSGDNNAHEENEQEKYDLSQDQGAPQLLDKTLLKSQPNNDGTPIEQKFSLELEYAEVHGANVKGQNTQEPHYRSKTLTYKKQLSGPSSHPQLPSSSPQLPSSYSGGAMVIRNPHNVLQKPVVDGRCETYVNQRIDSPGLKPLKFRTLVDPKPLVNLDQQMTPTSKKSVTTQTKQENSNTVTVKTSQAQPLVVIKSQQTPQKPQNIENAPPLPSPKDLPVVIASPKNQNTQNANVLSIYYLSLKNCFLKMAWNSRAHLSYISSARSPLISKFNSPNIGSIPKSDKILYKDLSPTERKMWQQEFIKNMIQEFMQFNNISEESVGNLDIVVENLLKIMDNPKAFLKFKNDILQQAKKSDSNHQNPFLIMMYGEEKSRELSNSKMLNISQDSCMELINRCYEYELITDPLRHAYVTRGVKRETNKDGDQVITIRSTEQMKQEEQQEIQRNNNETLLFDRLANNKSNLLELCLVMQNIYQKGLPPSLCKALVDGENLPEISRNLHKTALRYAVKIMALTINNTINPENYEMAAKGVKLLIGNGVQLVQQQIAGSVSFLRLTGGEKADEPEASSVDQKLLQDGDADKKPDETSASNSQPNPQPNLKGLFFVNGNRIPGGANPLGSFQWNKNTPSVPPTEEKKEETSEEITTAPNPADDLGTSGDTESSDDRLPEQGLGLKVKNPAHALISWVFGSRNKTNKSQESPLYAQDSDNNSENGESSEYSSNNNSENGESSEYSSNDNSENGESSEYENNQQDQGKLGGENGEDNDSGGQNSSEEEDQGYEVTTSGEESEGQMYDTYNHFS